MTGQEIERIKALEVQVRVFIEEVEGILAKINNVILLTPTSHTRELLTITAIHIGVGKSMLQQAADNFRMSR